MNEKQKGNIMLGSALAWEITTELKRMSKGEDINEQHIANRIHQLARLKMFGKQEVKQ